MEPEPLLGPKKISNVNVLTVTSICFALFVAAELIGALVSGSLSLLGDACAMAVDVFTYFSNMYAERVKEKQGYLDMKTKRILEVYIPSFSVCALLSVTAYIMSDAISVIQANDSGDELNVAYLYAFSCGNFVVDIVSVYMFYWRGAEAFENTVVFASFHTVNPDGSPNIMRRKQPADHITTDTESPPPPPQSLPPPSPQQPTAEELERRKKEWNLNMLSAGTHVVGDTLRTTSVFVAALISSIGHYDSDLCDAWAAIVVSITIIIAVVPLCLEIFKAWLRDRD